MPDGRLAPPGQRPAEARQQPFTLSLRTTTGDTQVLLRCVSPIGAVEIWDGARIEQINQAYQALGVGKICAICDARLERCNLTVEADILFHPQSTQREEIIELISRTVHCADHMEKALLDRDEALESFSDLLSEEADRA